MKKLMTLTALSLSVFGLVGCASNEGDSSSDKTTLKLWMDGVDYAEELEIAIEEKFENIDIVFENVAIGDAAEKLTLDGPAGLGGDIIFHTPESMGRAMQGGVLLPLGENLSQYVTTNIMEPSHASVTYEDTIYGVPMSTEALIMFYNKTLLEQNGLEVATTFEQIIEQAHGYNNMQEGKYLFRFEPGNLYTGYMFLTAGGYELFGPEGQDASLVNLNTPEVVQGLTYLKQVNEILDVASTDLNWDTVHGSFVNGEVGYMIGGPWSIEEVIESSEINGYEWGVMTLPTIDNQQPRPFLGNITASISAYTQYPEESREVLEFISSAEGLQLMYDVQGKLPALNDLSVIEGIEENEHLLVLSEQCNMSIAMPIVGELSTVYETGNIMLQSVWDDLATQEEAAKKAEDDYYMLIEMSK